MDLADFQKSVTESTVPKGLSAYLQSLWYDAKGDWNKAHEIIQDEENSNAAWIHAYLHRKEGDIANADYWYQRAGRIRPGISLQDEWRTIVSDLLHQ